MRMHNPPHPGKVLREYLGTRSVTDTAKHLGVTRVALVAHLEWQRGNFGGHGAEAGGCPGHQPRTMDRHADTVRSVASIPAPPQKGDADLRGSRAHGSIALVMTAQWNPAYRPLNG